MATDFLSAAKSYTKNKELQSILNVSRASEISVRFLAQGEYNVNFLLESPDKKIVLRLNTGSQMHLDNQIKYEYETLQILKKTNVTPKPLILDDSKVISPFGMLAMEYIPGRWLQYEKDFLLAADVFAKIHSIKYFNNSGLLTTPKPATAILTECKTMASVYLGSPLGKLSTKKIIEEKINIVAKLVERFSEPFDNSKLVLNNTEVNSSNFLFNEETGGLKLVDWEKAVFSLPAQDLSHFLVPTTTYWKTDFRFSLEQVTAFVKRYSSKTNQNISEIFGQLELFWPVTCLRGVTWCSMAYVEYQQPDRLLKNEFAYKKIKQYVQDDFIREVFKTGFGK